MEDLQCTTHGGSDTGFARESTLNRPKENNSLLVLSPEHAELADNLREHGFQVAECPIGRLLPSDLEGMAVILVPVTLRSLEDIFGMVHEINDWRFSPAAVEIAPNVLIMPNLRLLPSVVADFRSLCCSVSYNSGETLADELRVIMVERARLRDRGVTLLIVNDPPSSPRVFLVGSAGQPELDLSAREVRILKKLGSERRAFSTIELANAANCGPEQVRVYVERIKSEYDVKRLDAGVLMGKSELVDKPGKGLGYRLHARLKS